MNQTDRYSRKPTYLLLLALGLGCSLMGCQIPVSGKSKKNIFQRTKDSFRSILTDSYHDTAADEKLSQAQQYFAAGQYSTAESMFAELANNSYNPSAILEKARYMEAESLRMRGKMPAAVDAYHRYLQDFTVGTFSEQAAVRMYEIAEVWLKDSLKDIEARQKDSKFVSLPSLPNLLDDSKPKIDQEGTLLVTLENIAEKAMFSSVADKALFWSGFIYFSRQEFDLADEAFSRLVEFHKDSPLRQEALKYAVMAKNNATGGAVYDGTKSAEALQLVNHAEATDPIYNQDEEKKAWLIKQKMAIRYQQAMKDFETAEYYRRTDRYGPAFFYYEMVNRRYPGTEFATKASQRIQEIEQIKKQREADQAAGKQPFFERLQSEAKQWFGGSKDTDDLRPSGPQGPRPPAPSGIDPTTR